MLETLRELAASLTGNEIALLGVVVAIITGIAIPMLKGVFSKKTTEDTQPQTQDPIAQQLAAQQQTINKLLELLQSQSPQTSINQQEAQSVRQSLEQLLQSEDQEKEIIQGNLRAGKLDEAIAQFKQLDALRSQHHKDNASRLIDDKLQLAALLTYREPLQSLAYLQQAVELDSNHPDANNNYALLLMRLGKGGSKPEIFGLGSCSRKHKLNGKVSI